MRAGGDEQFLGLVPVLHSRAPRTQVPTVCVSGKEKDRRYSFPCYVKFMFVNTIVCFPREQFCYDEINDSSLKLGNHTVHMDTLRLHVEILYVGIDCLSD